MTQHMDPTGKLGERWLTGAEFGQNKRGQLSWSEGQKIKGLKEIHRVNFGNSHQPEPSSKGRGTGEKMRRNELHNGRAS